MGPLARLSMVLLAGAAQAESPAGLGAELTVFPAVMELSAFTQSLSTEARVALWLNEQVGLTVEGGARWWSRDAPGHAEMIASGRIKAEATQLVTPGWRALVGLEVRVLQGIVVAPWGDVHLAIVAGASAGPTGTTIGLSTPVDRPGQVSQVVIADAGVRLTGRVRAGLLVGLGQHVRLRLELADTFFASDLGRFQGPDCAVGTGGRVCGLARANSTAIVHVLGLALGASVHW